MTTYADLQADIADDIDDTTGEYAPQIKKAILSAIRYCERETYYFNETRDITFPTVNGREWYTAADNANIPTLVHIAGVWSEDSAGVRSIIAESTPQELELLSDNAASRGEPYAYVYFGQRIRLYPVPNDAVYTIRLQVGPYRLAPLVNDGDQSAWIDEAYDMIKARAKYNVYKNTLKDAALAAEALNDFTDQELKLKGETTSRNGTGCIQATSF